MNPDPIVEHWSRILNPDHIPAAWLALGLLAQLMFTSRFVVQWIASERRRESVVPALFWWLSIAGGGLLLAYGVHRGDPVIILGQLGGLVVYVRNLVLIRRKRRTGVS